VKLTKKNLSNLILEYLEEVETGAELFARMTDKALPADHRKKYAKALQSIADKRATAKKATEAELRWRTAGGIAQTFMEKFPGSKKKKACDIMDILQAWEGKAIGEKDIKIIKNKFMATSFTHRGTAGAVGSDPFEENEEQFIINGIKKYLKGKRMQATSDNLKKEFGC
tara:strand:- start:1012 stop:1518 length:507 start_codon:yes stop_codon:yes gene_type:complete